MHPNKRNEIIEEAKLWLGTSYLMNGNSKDGIDCSHFVWQVYRAVVYPNMPYIFSNPKRDGEFFKRVCKTQLLKGDLVTWGDSSFGHIGIIVDTIQGTFIGAQSGGVAIAFYNSGYWATTRAVNYFLQSKW